ncbi:MAG: crotonase/enoyl-CoA hydratase family protein [Pararhizobium sp.]
MTNHVLIERPPALRGAVQVIRLNRPEKKNAITRAMYAAMAEALRAGDQDPAIRVHVFLGLPGMFSAGNDIRDFVAYAEGGALGREVIDFLKALAGAEKPLVSGVDGPAIGIGTTLNLHCDLTFATPRSEVRTPFVDLALVPEAGSSLLAPRLMGHQRAFALLAAGLPLSAEAARDAGLVYRLADEAGLEGAVFEAAGALASKPPQALTLARDLIRGPRAEILRRIDEEAGHFAERLKTNEARQALEAFFNRRR